MKKIFLLIAAFCAMSYFAACSDLLSEAKTYVAIATENENELSSGEAVLPYSSGEDVLPVSSGEAMLSFSLDAKNDISCSAMPNISADFFDSITIYYRPVDGTRDIEIGTWNSNGALKAASVPFKAGTWIFSVLAVCETGYYYTEETKTINAGKNSLLFTLIPMMMQELEARHGYGSLYVSAAFPVDNLKCVTGGLYTMDEEKVPGFEDEVLQVSQRGTTYYEHDDIPAGDYILIFKFFADTEKKILLGTYREFAGIFALARSESKVVLQSLSNLHSISYETNGGAFAEGYSPCLSYTRHSQSLSLPDKTQITKAGSDFDGWYEDENFEGPVVDFIPSGSVGNRKFYAKWLDKWTVTFLPNGGSFADGSKIKTQQIKKGASENLVTADGLGLTNNGRNFLGWITSITNVSADYADGAQITPKKNIVLMALWSQGNVSGGDDGKTKDADGDGVSDYDELYKFFTDPANKDTDGDGWTDGQELNYYTEGSNTFNPRIADVPQLEIQFVGRPEIGFNYQTSSTNNVTESVTHTDGTVHSQSATNTNSHTRNETHGWHAKVGVGFEWSAGTDGSLGFFGAKAKNTFSFEAGYNGSVTAGDTFTYSRNQSESFSQSVTKGHTTSETTGKTVSGGTILVNAKFKNPSNLAYTVRSATVTFAGITDFRQPNGYPTPVASVELTNVGTIPPGGETGMMTIKYDKLSVEQTEELLKWSSGLNMSITNYTIALQKEGFNNGNDFTGALTTVNAMTACLNIDYGPSAKHKAETHHVATKYLYNPESVDINGLYKKVTIKDLLEIAGISESKGNLVLGNGGRIKSIRDYNYEGYRYGAWYVQHTYTKDNLSKSDTYNYYSDPESGQVVDISKIDVQAGDLINIFYSIDKDKDGVPYNEELICGTSDDKPDTDGDGLTDAEELYGWKPATKNRSSFPAGSVTEQHKIIEEIDATKKIITNPNNPDTDGDGYDDLNDPDPIEPKMKNITSLSVTQYKTSADENAKFKDFIFEAAQYLEDIYESVYLNLVPTMPHEKIECKQSEGAAYQDFSSAKEFKLDLGQNKIWIKVTAADGFTTKESVLTFESRLRPLENLQMRSPDGKGNTMTLSYNAYTDRRVVADDTTAGLLLHIVKGNELYDSEPDLGLANPNDLPDFMSYVATAKDRNGISENDYDFWTKVSVADLKHGTTTISGLKSQTLYSIDSIMYYESGAKYARVSKGNKRGRWLNSTYWVHGTTGKSQKATLTFWMHYLRAVSDEDGGTDPQYYWSISSGAAFLANLSNDCATMDSKTGRKFDDDEDMCYTFGDKKMNGGTKEEKIEKGGSQCKCYKGVFDRMTQEKDHEFKINFSCWDYDPKSDDDFIGDVTMTVKYSVTDDKWYFKWSGDHTDNGEMTVGFREGRKDDKWNIPNTSEGQIAVHWGAEWNDEPASQKDSTKTQ